MASQSIASDKYTYSKEQGLTLFIQSVKGNAECKDQRKVFNLCRATPLGKFVEPEFCKDKALSFVNCFLNMQRNSSKDCVDKFSNVFQCAMKDGNCQNDLDAYVNCK